MAGYTQLSTGIYGEPVFAGSQTFAGAFASPLAGALSGLPGCAEAKGAKAANSNPTTTPASNIPLTAQTRLLAFIIPRDVKFRFAPEIRDK
jgi:hypothetical protein